MKFVERASHNYGKAAKNDLGFILWQRYWKRSWSAENNSDIYTTVWIGKRNPTLWGGPVSTTFTIYYTKSDLGSQVRYKGITVEEGFKTSKEAMLYVNSHLEEILALEFEVAEGR